MKLFNKFFLLMWKWFKKKETLVEDADMQLLAGKMSEIGRGEFLSVGQKGRMRAELMEVMDWMEIGATEERKRLPEKIRQLGEGKFLSHSKKKLIYSQLMEKVAMETQPWRWLARSWKAGLASVMIGFLALASFVLVPMDLRVTRASKWTFLESVNGQVFVNRDGKIWRVDKNFGLIEGDLIFTMESSSVTVRYLDDSVTRLGENTSMEIKKLYVQPDNAAKTNVELALIGGQLWASVYNLIDSESTFVVETGNARADVNNKAAFEMKSLQNSTVLTVFDNVVDVSKKSGKIENVQPIVAGFKAEINDKPIKIASNTVDVLVEKNTELSDPWVITNQTLDAAHQEKLKEENSQFASTSTVSNSTLGVLADLKDQTKPFFSNADIEAARQRFLDVHLGIIRAEDLLNKDDLKQSNRRLVTPLLLQYKTAIREIAGNFENLHVEDAGQADQLLLMMKESIDLQRKALSLVMPAEKLYVIKEVVNGAGLLLAMNSVDKAAYLLDGAKNRLSEMQTLIAKNDLKGAEASFRNYLGRLDELVVEVEKSQKAEIEGSLFALIDDQIKQFKQLTAIEVESRDKNYMHLADLVEDVKMDSAKKLVGIIKFYRKTGIPFETVLEMQNTVGEYLSDSADKLAMLDDLKIVLVNYSEYKDFLLQQKAQEDLEKAKAADKPVVIEDKTATENSTAVVPEDLPSADQTTTLTDQACQSECAQK